MTGIEADKESIGELAEKIDRLLDERESMAMTKLSKQSLSAFLAEEPALYTIRDAGVVYR